jgi:hypothetical protein
MSTLGELPSGVCGKRSNDWSCIPAAPARLRDQELFSVLASRYFRTKAVERRIGTDFDLDTFDLTAVIAGLTDDLRKLTFMNTGRGRGLSDRHWRTNHQRQSKECQFKPSRHLFLPFHRKIWLISVESRKVRFHSMTLNAFAMSA